MKYNMAVYVVGDFLRETRLRKGYTQEEVSYGICTTASLSRIENGAQKPGRLILEKLFERLGTENNLFNSFVSREEMELYSAIQELIRNVTDAEIDKIHKQILVVENLTANTSDLERQCLLFAKGELIKQKEKDYQTAAQTFITYFNTYPRGTFTELARFHAGKALFLDTPEPRLDQSSTYQAIQQLQMFMEYFPNSVKKQEAQDMIFALQDKLVLKELYSAKLYYNLGNYMGNNYESCVITAQNALKDYPYTDYREELSILILRARHEMAIYSVEDKKMDRYRETVDEYYAFKNEFPESKYLKEAEKIFNESQKVIKD